MQEGYTQTDTTGAKVAGESWHTHILCSDNFMPFSTLKGKGHKHFLYALQGLCWIHDARNYNKTTPFVKYHQQLVENFQCSYLGFINLPYFTRQEKHRQEISTFIVAFINLYVILFLACIIRNKQGFSEIHINNTQPCK